MWMDGWVDESHEVIKEGEEGLDLSGKFKCFHTAIIFYTHSIVGQIVTCPDLVNVFNNYVL